MVFIRNIYKQRNFDYARGKHYAQSVRTVPIFLLSEDCFE